MSEVTLDCKGLPCPQPLLACKKCLEASAPLALTVRVDNEAARENVSRFLAAKGYAVSSSGAGADLAVNAVLAPGEAEAPSSGGAPCPCAPLSAEDMARLEKKVLVFLAAEQVGAGDETLGGRLMLNFLGTLPELGSSLWRLILVNGAVKMAAAGHPCLEKLKALESAGVSILVCGTCLDFFGLLDKKEAGQTTNMLDVVTSLGLADRIIRP